MKAIILAGGLGTRLRPLTDITPKPLLLIQGKPIMQHTIENLKQHGFKDIILAISYQADKIKEYFVQGQALGVNLEYSLEVEPLGTGGAVKQAAEQVGEDFVLLWGDNMMDIDITAMVKAHQNHPGLITMALTSREDVENYGVAELAGDKVVGFVEKPKQWKAPTNLINAGAFVISKEALNILPKGKSSIEKQCFEILAKQGQIFGFKHVGQWFPTDTLEKYEKAAKEFKIFNI